MAERDWRFYAANVAAAALLVNGIGHIAGGRAKKPAATKGAEGESSCCFEHAYDHVCGAAAVAGAVCLQDRLPYAGMIGALATALPLAQEGTRKDCCPRKSSWRVC
eukprot:TRINITY_DN1124_c0_g1_i4.p2 TRINITY_DN1124_c0_g1~~TRINITY_DN1124_c0_g1_i4.p2  ORF type:complete len:106 (+),score=18.57 TRINITY_DN1124_c0_g1_i4:133-450(+)